MSFIDADIIVSRENWLKMRGHKEAMLFHRCVYALMLMIPGYSRIEDLTSIIYGEYYGKEKRVEKILEDLRGMNMAGQNEDKLWHAIIP